MKLLLIVCLLLAGGCSHKGSIRSKEATVIGVPDAGKPATLATENSVATLPIPAGSTVIVTKSEATAAEPAKEEVRIDLPKATEWRKTETKIQADTGTIDTSVAKHRIDAQENRVLLYAALASALAAGFFIYRAYPTPAFICGGAAVVFFLAWKLSDLPSWFYAIGAIGLAAAIFLYLGHERAEKTAVESTNE